jgi:hypothetical protein
MDVVPAELVEPDGHELHAIAPAVAYVFGGQVEAVPLGHDDPAGHWTHDPGSPVYTLGCTVNPGLQAHI